MIGERGGGRLEQGAPRLDGIKVQLGCSVEVVAGYISYPFGLIWLVFQQPSLKKKSGITRSFEFVCCFHLHQLVAGLTTFTFTYQDPTQHATCVCHCVQVPARPFLLRLSFPPPSSSLFCRTFSSLQDQQRVPSSSRLDTLQLSNIPATRRLHPTRHHSSRD